MVDKRYMLLPKNQRNDFIYPQMYLIFSPK